MVAVRECSMAPLSWRRYVNCNVIDSIVMLRWLLVTKNVSRMERSGLSYDVIVRLSGDMRLPSIVMVSVDAV